ncbi:MAG: GNAT family N-acetyltransferase [Caldilineaceae bacterium]|nr:GNAT family N-acetyltransferase [Caldilineaceae bacterium]MBP8107918.1 GNAT family N-acetyltransferase [Caldilineaceae bacterium]MBP9073291.1 GNAT family N-acetyltransferase [Caldilineaceae bacterium]
MIQTIEETAFRAVPAAICLHFDGWRLRFNHAVTRRANSVWPNADFGRHSLAEKLDAVETFYRNHGTTPRFQITSAALPVGLDDFLANCGYAKSQINDVQIADTSQVIQASRAAPALPVTLTPSWTPAWLDTYCAIEHVAAHRRPLYDAMWGRVRAAKAFGLVVLDGQPAAVGLCVADGEWAGLFNIATHPDFRRRGAAIALIHALVSWAGARGAAHLYLQVRSQNEPALALYGRLGFSTLYQYHYRELA